MTGAALSPRVLIVGTVDTKGDELGFLREQVLAAGGQPQLMDVGVRGTGGLVPEVSSAEVAAAAGCTLSVDGLSTSSRVA